MGQSITYEEKKEISHLLTSHHGVFYKFWELVRPEFSDSIPTACVGVDKKNNNLNFQINKNFWDKCSDNQKRFVIAHEAYHLINQHGARANGEFDDAKNVCLDIPINEGLVKYFGFNRSEIDPTNDYCWVDKWFKNGEAEHGKSFEYYYALLKKQGRIKSVKVPAKCNDHSNLPNKKAEDQFINNLVESLDQHEAETLKDILDRQNMNTGEPNKEEKKNGAHAGTGTAGIIAKIENKFVKKKPKWESIIRKYAKKIVEKEFETNHWIIKNRRHNLLDHSLLLPSDIDIDDRKSDKEKQSIFCFLDVSGSCWGYKERFYKAFKSIPKTIKVRLFSFDDVAYELDKDSNRVIGGGGTSFKCIENKIQQIIKQEGIQYPKNIFVLTDGYANIFYPQYPNRWVFLLTTDYKECIPPKSKIFNLQDFE